MLIAILSASTRMERKSHRVALALQKHIVENTAHEAVVLDLLAYRFPVFEEVLLRHPNPPEGLDAFAQKIRAADAHIWVSPEYNGSYTSALKNAVDYLKESEFSRKAVGVVSVSAGAMGGMRAAMNMQELVLGVGGYPVPQMLMVGLVGQRFDESGELLDPAFEKSVNNFFEEFLWLAEAVSEKRLAGVGA